MDIGKLLWQERVSGEERARLDQYQRAWRAYFGEHDPIFRAEAGEPDSNVVVNYARAIVDTGVAFLFGSEPQFDLDGKKGRNPAEQWLDDVWRRNRKLLTLQKLGINGGVTGHAYLRLAMGKPAPRVIVLSPEYVTVRTDADDIEAVWLYIIEYPAVDRDGKMVTIRQEIEQAQPGVWVIRDMVSRNGGTWERRPEVRWPWAWSPVVDCQNLPSPNEYYGVADIEGDILKLNHSINFVLSNLQRIIRYHAHPKTWTRGVTAKEIDTSVKGIIALTNAEAAIGNLEMTSDLKSSIEYYARLKEAMFQVAQVPEVATGKMESVGSLSGVALQILYQPLIQRTQQKQLTYGELLKEVNRRLLEMGGYGGEQEVNIHWSAILPANALEERQVAQIDRDLGVSQDTILEGLGYDPVREREMRQATQVDAAEQMMTAWARGGGVDEEAVAQPGAID